MNEAKKFLELVEDHDYNVDWDYDRDSKPDPSVTWIVRAQVSKIKKDIFPVLNKTFKGIFNSFKVEYVKGLKNLGMYVNGTSSSPVVVLDIKQMKNGSKEYGIDMETVVLSTVVHELGHAIQDYLGLDPSEEDAEELAHTYWERGEVTPELLTRLFSE